MQGTYEDTIWRTAESAIADLNNTTRRVEELLQNVELSVSDNSEIIRTANRCEADLGSLAKRLNLVSCENCGRFFRSASAAQELCADCRYTE